MMLRTIAYNDQVAFPWFAPAGVRRGVIDNATSVGYINSEGEFETTAVSEGLRDSLYSVNVNPISFITGAGLLNFGQKTRQLTASALDRINVARLVAFVRLQLDKITRPYIFEPNDALTRNEVKQAIESFFLELTAQRALYDFAVVCDETNNTPARIDRNELYVDVAIEPVKAVEFIYIPVRLKNTGEIAAQGL
jgi:phage tail sheath protein FI